MRPNVPSSQTDFSPTAYNLPSKTSFVFSVTRTSPTFGVITLCLQSTRSSGMVSALHKVSRSCACAARTPLIGAGGRTTSLGGSVPARVTAVGAWTGAFSSTGPTGAGGGVVPAGAGVATAVSGVVTTAGGVGTSVGIAVRCSSTLGRVCAASASGAVAVESTRKGGSFAPGFSVDAATDGGAEFAGVVAGATGVVVVAAGVVAEATGVVDVAAGVVAGALGVVVGAAGVVAGADGAVTATAGGGAAIGPAATVSEAVLTGAAGVGAAAVAGSGIGVTGGAGVAVDATADPGVTTEVTGDVGAD